MRIQSKQIETGLKIVGGVLAAGAATSGVGYLLQSGTGRLIQAIADDPRPLQVASKAIAAGLNRTGEALYKAGKFTAYTVLVPTYFMGYVVPKWILQKGLPKVLDVVERGVVRTAQIVNKYVVDPAFRFVYRVASRLEQGIRILEKYVIVPLARSLSRAIQAVLVRIRDSIIVPFLHVAEWAFEKMDKALSYLERHIIRPITQAVAILVRRSFEALVKVAKLVDRCVIQPGIRALRFLGTSVFRLARTLHQHVIRPILRMLDRALVRVAEIIDIYVFQPALRFLRWTQNQIERAMKLFSGRLIKPLIRAVAKACRTTGELLVRGARAVHRVVVRPLWNLAKAGAKWTHTHVIRPILRGTVVAANAAGRVALRVAKAVYQHVIVPTEKCMLWVGTTALNVAEHAYNDACLLSRRIFRMN